MSNKNLSILFYLLFLATSLIHPKITFAAPQYFGYYNVNGLNPVDSKSHIPEIGAKGYSNIGVITVSVTDRLPQYLAEMRQHHMYAILGVTAKFEDSNREANWIAVKEAIKGHEDVIYGFYFDEPFWTGIDLPTFRAYTQQIKSDYPTKAVIAIEAYPPIENNSIPAGYYDFVTDLGFDFYPTLYTLQSGGFDAAWQRYLTDFAKIETLGQGKKLWLVPDGYNYPIIETSWLGVALTHYYELALARPNVTGLLVFRYDPGDNDYYTIQDVLNPSSTRYNPEVSNIHDTIGKAIIGSGPSYPSASPTGRPGDLDHNGLVDYYDYHLLIAKYGNPYAWSDYNTLISTYGK